MPTPTILQIIPSLDTGGAELSTIEIAEAVVSGGGRALVLSTGGQLASRLAAVGGELIPFPAATKNPARIMWNAQRIAQIVRRQNVSLVHARSRAPAWSAMIAARACAIPFVTTYHGAYSEKTRLKNIYNSVMARSDITIANSHYTAGLIKSRYQISDDCIRVIYRGVDGNRFDASKIPPERIAALRAKWGVAPEQRIVLHAARVSPIKGQAVVIAAADKLQRQGKLKDTVFILAGGSQGRDSYVAQLESQIDTAGLEGVVRLTGHLDDMPAGLAASHLALMVSTEPEGFGRVAAEAQAASCPVIVTRVGALPETVLAAPRCADSEATGWVVTPNDADELAEAIMRGLALTGTERTALTTRARARALSEFSTTRMQTETLAVYDQLLATNLRTRFEATRGSKLPVDLKPD
jgi:glycosyltransferase involved in cell wall biosynthesis